MTLRPAEGGARVALRLYDEMVRDHGAGGVLLLPPHGAQRLAEVLRAAIARQLPACDADTTPTMNSPARPPKCLGPFGRKRRRSWLLAVVASRT